MTRSDIAAIAQGLTGAQRKMIFAGSATRPKRWKTIRRHAKVGNAYLGNLSPFYDHVSGYPWPWLLTPLGILVRDFLREVG